MSSCRHVSEDLGNSVQCAFNAFLVFCLYPIRWIRKFLVLALTFGTSLSQLYKKLFQYNVSSCTSWWYVYISRFFWMKDFYRGSFISQVNLYGYKIGSQFVSIFFTNASILKLIIVNVSAQRLVLKFEITLP